jgi:hypothetical protein
VTELTLWNDAKRAVAALIAALDIGGQGDLFPPSVAGIDLN